MSLLIDREHLALQTFGDTDLAAELLELFAEQCRRLLPAIRDPALPAAERADLAHTLKGSALGVGAERVADLSAAVEDAFRRHGTVEASTLEALAEAVQTTLRAISEPV